MDTLIIFTAKLLGWLVLALLVLLATYAVLQMIWRNYRNVHGWPVVRRALREYYDRHPEKNTPTE